MDFFSDDSNRLLESPTFLASELLLLVACSQYDHGNYSAALLCDKLLSGAVPDLPGAFSGTLSYATNLQAASAAKPVYSLSSERSRYLSLTIQAILSVTSDPGFSKLMIDRTKGDLLFNDTRLFAYCEHHLLSREKLGSYGPDLETTIVGLYGALTRDDRLKIIADSHNALYQNCERISFALILLVSDYAQIIVLRQLVDLGSLSGRLKPSMSTFFRLLECLSNELSVIAAIGNWRHANNTRLEEKRRMPLILEPGLKRFEVDHFNKDIYASTYMGASAIRLMCIEPADDAAPLDSWLLDHDLKDKNQEDFSPKKGQLHAGTYDAISYAWTASTPAFTKIKVDGCRYIIVAKHVASALRRLRNPYEPTYVWIDCICVNQADPVERGRQVELMKDIFTRARKVIIWLGGNTTITPDSRIAGKIGTVTNALKADDQWSWWRRLWVVQEFAVARELEVAFDGLSMSWPEFISCCTAQRVLENSDSLHDTINAVLSLTKIKERFLKAPIGFKMFQLLRLTSASHSTNLLDRIFALQGLLSDSCRPSLIRHQLLPDYTKEREVLFLQTTLHILDVEECLDVLVWRWRSLWSLGLTWVPDYTQMLSRKVALCDCGYSTSANSRPIWYVGGEDVRLGIQEGKLTQNDAVNAWWSSSKSTKKSFTLSITAIEVDMVHKIWSDMNFEADRRGKTNSTEEDRDSIPSLVAAFTSALMIASERKFPSTDPRSSLLYAKVPPFEGIQASLTEGAEFDLGNFFDCWRSICNNYNETDSASESPLDCVLSEFRKLSPSLKKGLAGRATFATNHGLVGFGSCDTRRGDIVIVALGASVPFVLRPTKKGYRLIGDAYVDGIMYGEVVRLNEKHPDSVKLSIYDLI